MSEIVYMRYRKFHGWKFNGPRYTVRRHLISRISKLKRGEALEIDEKKVHVNIKDTQDEIEREFPKEKIQWLRLHGNVWLVKRA